MGIDIELEKLIMKRGINEMDTVKIGKKIVIGIILSNIILDIVVIGLATALYVSYGSMDKALLRFCSGMIRVVLECILFFCLYKGRKWANTILIVLYSISGVLGAVGILFSGGIQVTTMPSIVVITVYIVSLLLLLLSKSVKRFLEYQRDGAGLIPDYAHETSEI